MIPEVFYIILAFICGASFSWLLIHYFYKVKTSFLNEQLSQEKRKSQELEGKVVELEEKIEGMNKELSEKNAEIIRLNEELRSERERFKEKMQVIEKAQVELEKAFKAVSSEVLQKNNEIFLQLAKEKLQAFKEEMQNTFKAKEEAIEHLTKPIKEALEKVSYEIREMEAKREGAYRGIEEQIKSLVRDHIPRLQKETESLARALRQPQVRGRWGEIQLKRVVEMSGMLPHCDFYEQVSYEGEDGTLRPDLVINLPGNKKIAVDSKAPFNAYIEALESDGDKMHEKLKEYARAIRKHIQQLSDKKYWEGLQRRLGRSPEFVILFIPGEAFFSAALQVDPTLIEFGVERKVLIATPITLIAILRAVAYSWHEQSMAENAIRIAKLGKELYERLKTLTSHLNGLGRALDKTVELYNKAVGSYERRVLSSARRFENLLAIQEGDKIMELEELTSKAKTIDT